MIEASAVFSRPLRKQDMRPVVERVYHAVLGRAPSLEEKRLAHAFLASSPSIADGVKDLHAVLFMSPEFEFIK